MQTDWDEVREIIKDYLDANNLNSNQLAHKVGIDRTIVWKFLSYKTKQLDIASVIRIYTVLQTNMNTINRRRFLKAAGMLSLALVLSRDYQLLADLQYDSPDQDPRIIGHQLMVAGLEESKRSWESAVSIFLRAEQQFGGASSQAARAACEVIQQFINLGDYDRAKSEILRVQNTYEGIMDPETEIVLHEREGWVDYYQANYVQSEKSFLSALKIAEQAGLELTIGGIYHFLGRLYRDWGQVCIRIEERTLLFYKAEFCLDKAYEIRNKHGIEGDVAFDLIRKSELMVMQEIWTEIPPLLAKSKQLFGKYSPSLAHIELVEAKLEILNGEIKVPRKKVETALQRWIPFKFASGIAHALRTLGDVEYLQATRPNRTLEIYFAALCVYPFENNLANRKMWENIENICASLRQENEQEYHRLLLRMMEMAQTQRGHFSYLSHIAADREQYILSLFDKLLSKR